MDWIDTDRDISSTGAKLKEVHCPNCDEDKNLTDSPFNSGDTLCKVCGAVFAAGADHAIMYDMDVARDYATMKRAMGV
jgi:transcription elongation factor Elf1